MRLHQINQLDYPETIEASWQNSLQSGDQIVLIESGILRLVQHSNMMQTLLDDKNIALYYLQNDATAYGLSPKIGTPLTDEEWVTLTYHANTHLSW